MSDDEIDAEDGINIDFTDQSQIRWRQIEEGYSPSQFFSEEGLHDKFVSRLSINDEQSITRIKDRYAEYLASQIQYLSFDWELECWTDDAAQTVAMALVNQYGNGGFASIRRDILERTTERELWGVSRYEHARSQFALEVLEEMGADRFRQIIDVRPKTQFEIFYPEQPMDATDLFTVNRIDNVAVRQLLEAFGISDREFARTALPFHSTLEPSWFVDWTTTYVTEGLRFRELASIRWHEAIKYPTSIDILEFTAVLLGVSEQWGIGRSVRDILTDIRLHAPDPEISTRGYTDYVTEMSILSDEAINLFNQVLEGALHPHSRPAEQIAEGSTASDIVSAKRRESHPEFAEEEAPKRLDDVDRSYTRLFIIPAAGKPAEIEPREITREELIQSNVIEVLDELDEAYTAYAAPASQHRTVNGMSTGDIVLFATEDAEYLGEYRIEHVLLAPETVQGIWDEYPTNGDHQVRLPFLLLLSRPRVRRIEQDRLNQLLGYRSNSTPSLWGVAPYRIKRLTDSGSSLEEIITRLNQG